MLRYLRLLGIQMRTSILLALQYRVEFVLDFVMAMFWTMTAIIPLFILYAQRQTVAGWSWPEALMVVGFFTVLKGVLSGMIQPSLQAVVDHVRKGTLDFLLLKPVDAQFMMSTAQFELWHGTDVIGGLIVLGYALARAGRAPSPGDVVMAAALVGGAVVILYAIFVMVISLAFRFVKIDNLTYFFMSIYDAARWPASVFRGFFAMFFTFVIPLALMTTYPALALLGRLTWGACALALAFAAVFFTVSRGVWLLAIRHYTSAGG